MSPLASTLMIFFTSSSFPAIVALLSFILLYAAYLRMRRQRSTFPQSLEEMMSMGAQKAVARARSRYGVPLDFSIDSLRSVDTILARIHQEFVAAPRLADVNSLGFVFGSYIGETIRRTQPGCAWERNHGDAGDNSYPLHWGESTCFPIGWCVRRIREGEEESVWKNYEMARQMASGQYEVKSRKASAG